jgi:5-enolpyruvylshikimate-3-phosphate synthase
MKNKRGIPLSNLKGSFEQQTRKISIKGNISSQYITALLLIAVKLPFGLELHIEGELTSRPYVEMTLAMLKEANILHTWEANVIYHITSGVCNHIVTRRTGLERSILLVFHSGAKRRGRTIPAGLNIVQPARR